VVVPGAGGTAGGAGGGGGGLFVGSKPIPISDMPYLSRFFAA